MNGTGTCSSQSIIVSRAEPATYFSQAKLVHPNNDLTRSSIRYNPIWHYKDDMSGTSTIVNDQVDILNRGEHEAYDNEPDFHVAEVTMLDVIVDKALPTDVFSEEIKNKALSLQKSIQQTISHINGNTAVPANYDDDPERDVESEAESLTHTHKAISTILRSFPQDSEIFFNGVRDAQTKSIVKSLVECSDYLEELTRAHTKEDKRSKVEDLTKLWLSYKKRELISRVAKSRLDMFSSISDILCHWSEAGYAKTQKDSALLAYYDAEQELENAKSAVEGALRRQFGLLSKLPKSLDDFNKLFSEPDVRLEEVYNPFL
ncbi:uncharacterized protein L201_007236 [Kwoniella dendrophila CBS 6074]|uniref:Uncharacterized protein n=1 Tax=Kwoniella dendrophila CBS 6074 TaxID=1295534 RepID=A0AAX4K3U7_9TREE